MRVNGSQVALVAAALGLGVAGNRFLRRLRAIDLSGKVVLITGGSRGLGLALAEEFTHQGARLPLRKAVAIPQLLLCCVPSAFPPRCFAA